MDNNSIMNRIIFNNKEKTDKEITQIFSNLLEHNSITRNGGYLFNFAKQEDTCSHILNMCPVIVEGERMYHYQIQLSDKAQKVLTGGFTSSSEIQILIKETIETNELRLFYIKLYISFCRLIPSEHLKKLHFDFASRQIIENHLGINLLHFSVFELLSYNMDSMN